MPQSRVVDLRTTGGGTPHPVPYPRAGGSTAGVFRPSGHGHALPRRPIQVRCVLSTVAAGLAGAVAVVPPSAIAADAGYDVVWYSRTLTGQLTGRDDTAAYLALHALIGIATVFPLALFWRSFGRPRVVARRAAAGAVYGALVWLVLYCLALPTAYRIAYPWTVGFSAVWPALGELVLYGVVAAVVLGWVARCPLEAQGTPCGHRSGIECLFRPRQGTRSARHRSRTTSERPGRSRSPASTFTSTSHPGRAGIDRQENT